MYQHLVPRTRTGKPRPVIISHSRYNRILAVATNADKLQQQAALAYERERQAQLQEEGEKLLLQFGSNVCPSQSQRVAKLREYEKQKQQAYLEEQIMVSQAETSKQEAIRKARIAKAQLSIERLRPGPRELQSAQLQSKVLYAMNLQRKLQNDFAEAQRQQRELDNKMYDERIREGIRAAQQEQQKRAQNAQKYKEELKQLITSRSEKRSVDRAQELRTILAEREASSNEISEQLEKERLTNLHKRNVVRRHALESIHMSEERQKRLNMLDEIEKHQCEHYKEAKSHLEGLKINQSKERMRKRIERNEQLANVIAPQLHYSATQDNRRYERDLNVMRTIFSAEEKSRHARIKATKEMRIETHQQAQALAKTAQEQLKVQRQQDQLERIENEKIQKKFKQAEHCKFLKGIHELRKVFDEQVRQRQADEKKPDVNYNKNAYLEHLKEHKFFFDYAKQLISEAKARDCPLKPFVRAVDQYKRMHNIAAETKTPRHLVSKLTLGLRQPGDSEADANFVAALAKEAEKQEQSDEQKDLACILNDCKQIEEMVASEQKQTKTVNK